MKVVTHPLPSSQDFLPCPSALQCLLLQVCITRLPPLLGVSVVYMVPVLWACYDIFPLSLVYLSPAAPRAMPVLGPLCHVPVCPAVSVLCLGASCLCQKVLNLSLSELLVQE